MNILYNQRPAYSISANNSHHIETPQALLDIVSVWVVIIIILISRLDYEVGGEGGADEEGRGWVLGGKGQRGAEHGSLQTLQINQSFN